jgi:hypothetical protein
MDPEISSLRRTGNGTEESVAPSGDTLTVEEILQKIDKAENDARERKSCMKALENMVRSDITTSPPKIPAHILAQEKVTSARLYGNLYVKSDVEIDTMMVAGRTWPLIAVHYTDPSNEQVPYLNMLNLKPPTKSDHGAIRHKCFYSSFDWIPTPEMETFQVKDPNCYYQYDTFAAVSFKCDAISFDNAEDSSSVPIPLKQSPRVYVSMCQLDSTTHGTRFILLRILMTLCATNRTD